MTPTPSIYFNLGDFVIHPTQPEWGLGQIQSIVGMNVTVNFEHVGKQQTGVHQGWHGLYSYCHGYTWLIKSSTLGHHQQMIHHGDYH